MFALLSCAQSLEVGPHCARLGRRAVLHSGLLVFPAAAALAAEPEPTKTLTDEEMAARVARKMELLKKQGAKGRGDAKVLYGADYQKGIRGTKTTFTPQTSPSELPDSSSQIRRSMREAVCC